MPESQLHFDGETKKQGTGISIAAPLTLWIALLIIGVFSAYMAKFLAASGIASLMTNISGWILYLPGSLIIPLVVSIWIGERVGSAKGGSKSAVKIGEINAIYTTLIYVVVVLIIYMLLYYILPTYLQTKSLTNYAEYVIGIPAVIVLALVPIVSALSAARRS